MDWFNQFLSIIFPKICPACYKRSCENEDLICLNCDISLPKTNQHLIHQNEFKNKFSGRLDIYSAAAKYYFSDSSEFRNLIHSLKYRNRYDVGYFIGLQYGKQLAKSEWFQGIDCVVPVPLHWSKTRFRSYNQSEAFARGLSKGMDIPSKIDFLKRIKRTSSQTKKSRLQRLENMNHAFKIGKKHKEIPEHILLVDDVITTGSTLELCAKTMLEAGCKRVSLSCIAMAYA